MIKGIRILRSINLISSEIAEKIEVFISKNNLKPHDKLPSERELADIWNVNRVTLRAGIEKLIDEGVLYNISGIGNYVAPKKIDRNLWQFLSFTDTMKGKGFSIKTKLISVRIVEANKQIGKILSVLLGTEIIEIKRLRIADEIPLDIEISYIPYNLCRGLEQYDLGNDSLYRILNEKYSINLVKQRQEISMGYASVEDSGYLEIKEGSAILVSRGITLNDKEEPVEYSVAFTRGDRCTFSSILK